MWVWKYVQFLTCPVTTKEIIRIWLHCLREKTLMIVGDIHIIKLIILWPLHYMILKSKMYIGNTYYNYSLFANASNIYIFNQRSTLMLTNYVAFISLFIILKARWSISIKRKRKKYKRVLLLLTTILQCLNRK